MASNRKTLSSARAARAVLLVVAASLGAWYVKSRVPADREISIAGAPFPIGRDVVRVMATPLTEGKASPPLPAQELPLDKAGDEDGTSSVRVRLLAAGDFRLEVDRKGGAHKSYTVHVQQLSRLMLVVALFSLIAFLLPYAFGSGAPDKGYYGAWYHLLSEPGGGYSLSRIQLLLWFVPTAVLYGALSFTLHAFVEIDTQLALLLGLSAATTMLGTAASPPPTAVGNVAVPPNLRDIVSDWDSHGDISRYQYLLLSIFGAFVLVAAFFRLIEMPDIPAQLLYLVAGSQGAYVATKVIKAARAGDRAAPTASPAPATISASATPPSPAGGSFVPADAAGPGVPADS